MPAKKPQKEPTDRESVATALGTANDAVDAFKGIGESAQALLEESGLWDPIAGWIREDPNAVNASADSDGGVGC